MGFCDSHRHKTWGQFFLQPPTRGQFAGQQK